MVLILRSRHLPVSRVSESLNLVKRAEYAEGFKPQILALGDAFSAFSENQCISAIQKKKSNQSLKPKAYSDSFPRSSVGMHNGVITVEFSVIVGTEYCSVPTVK